MTPNDTPNVFCRRCGRKCLAGDRFCPSCGQLLFPDGEDRETVTAAPADAAPAAESPLGTDATTPTAEGTTGTADEAALPRIPSPDAATAPDAGTAFYAAPAAPAPARVKKPRSPMVGRILSVRFFRNAAILLVSVLVLLAAFLPVVRLQPDTASYGIKGLEIRYSAVDVMQLFVDHLHSETAEEITDSRLYREYEDVDAAGEEEFNGIEEVERFDDLTHKQQLLLVRMIKLLMRLGARSEEAAFSPSLMIAAIASLLYLVFAVIFFVVALLQFFLWLCLGCDIGGAAMRMLCFIPGAVLARRFAFHLFMGNGADVKMTGSVVAVLVASLVLLVASMVVGLITKELRLRVGSAVRAGLTGVLACVMLCVLLLSPLSVKLTGKFRPSSYANPADTASTVRVKTGWDLFDSISMTDEQIAEVDDKTLEDGITALGYFSRSDFTRGKATAVSALNMAVANAFRLATEDGRGVGIFAFLPVLAFLTALACAWTMEESLLYFAAGGRKCPTGTFARLAMFAGAILLLVALIVAVIVCNATIGNTMISQLSEDAVFGATVGATGAIRRMMHLQLTAAPILTAVFALAALCVPAPGEKKRKEPSREAPEYSAAW